MVFKLDWFCASVEAFTNTYITCIIVYMNTCIVSFYGTCTCNYCANCVCVCDVFLLLFLLQKMRPSFTKPQVPIHHSFPAPLMYGWPPIVPSQYFVSMVREREREREGRGKKGIEGGGERGREMTKCVNKCYTFMSFMIIFPSSVSIHTFNFHIEHIHVHVF